MTMVNSGLKGLSKLNFHLFELVSRYHDPQLQVSEILIFVQFETK